MRRFSVFNFQFSKDKGFTLVEVSIVSAIFFLLVGMVTLNFFKIQNKTQNSSTTNSFLADMKEQQIKAMAGDTEGTATVSAYGVHFESASYTLFRNNYGVNNFVVSLPSSIRISGTNNQIIFATGSGELSPATNSATITISNSADSSQQVITLNRYGVVTSVN